MIKFCSLYSGSSGNSYFLEIDGTKLLVEAGTSAKKIEEALININENIKEIYGIIISHEHKDHSQSLRLLAKRHNLKVIISKKTKKALESELEKLPKENIIEFKRGEKTNIENARMKSFKISHDAVEPSGFTFKDKNNNKICIMTDLGIADEVVLENVKNSQILMTESNYEDNILQLAPYPKYIKDRISNNYGHLSNDQAAELSKYAALNGTKHILLGHISENSNTLKIAEITTNNLLEELKKENENINPTLEILKRDTHSNIYILD